MWKRHSVWYCIIFYHFFHFFLCFFRSVMIKYARMNSSNSDFCGLHKNWGLSEQSFLSFVLVTSAFSLAGSLPLCWWCDRISQAALASRLHYGSASSLRSPPLSTRRCLSTLHDTWLTTPTLAQLDCARLRLSPCSSVERGPTSATEASVQLDLESGTVCRRTSDSLSCHLTASDSRWRHCNLVSGTKAQCEPPLFKLRLRHSLTHLLMSTV